MSCSLPADAEYSLLDVFVIGILTTDFLVTGEVGCDGTLAVEMKKTAQTLSNTNAIPPMRNTYRANVSSIGNTLKIRNNLILIGLPSFGIVCNERKTTTKFVETCGIWLNIVSSYKIVVT